MNSIEESYNIIENNLQKSELRKQFQTVTYKVNDVENVKFNDNSVDSQEITQCSTQKSTNLPKTRGIAKNFAPQTCGPRFKPQVLKESQKPKEMFDSNLKATVKDFKVQHASNHLIETTQRDVEYNFKPAREEFNLQANKRLKSSNSTLTNQSILADFRPAKEEETYLVKPMVDNGFKTAKEELKNQTIKKRDRSFTLHTDDDFNIENKGTRYERTNSTETINDVAGNDFKTAKEELKVQTMKRHGSTTEGQSRKLAVRRGVQRKFVSPLLSNNEM